MNKLILFFIFLSLANPSMAALCKVYGISDSPQKLDCQFPKVKIELRCLEGKYHLNKTLVREAYHLEVEEGAVPLVFKTKASELTVMIQSKVDIQAEFMSRGKVVQGTCTE